MAYDPTETIRRELVAEINANPSPKAELEAVYGVGNVWTTNELSERFEVIGFMAPFAVVRERTTGAAAAHAVVVDGRGRKGSVEFQHSPRLYYNFIPEGK